MTTKTITDKELKELILEKTNMGLDYYESVDLMMEKISAKLYRSKRNPFYMREEEVDIYWLNNQWYYKYDLGKELIIGDIFKMCARLNRLDEVKDIVKVCAIIDAELELGLMPAIEIKIKSEESETSDGTQNTTEGNPVLPRISTTINASLPEFLKDLMALFQSRQDKDLLLLSTLTVLSGCFPKVYGKYARKKIHLNIYTMIVGPASAGKSVAKWARVLMENIENAYEELGKMLFFPADVSFASLIDSLAYNLGQGIIFAFEADTMTQNFTKEWGNIHALLRQAFEHERYENMRKGEKGQRPITLILKKPALTILLTGTPNQVVSLIPDTENGLFSRFNFYQMEFDPTWNSVFPDGDDEGADISLDELLTPFKIKALDIFESYNDSATSTISFDLSREQKQRLDTHYAALSERFKMHTKTNAIATIRRQGVVCFRLAGILTAVRQYQEHGSALICTDEDFQTALTLSDIFSHHAFAIARQLPGAYQKRLFGQKGAFFRNLPKQFNRQEANKVGEDLGIKENTVEGYLKDLQPEYLEHLKHNLYKKVE